MKLLLLQPILFCQSFAGLEPSCPDQLPSQSVTQYYDVFGKVLLHNTDHEEATTFLLLSATQDWTRGVAAPVQEVGFKSWKPE